MVETTRQGQRNSRASGTNARREVLWYFRRVTSWNCTVYAPCQGGSHCTCTSTCTSRFSAEMHCPPAMESQFMLPSIQRWFLNDSARRKRSLPLRHLTIICEYEKHQHMIRHVCPPSLHDQRWVARAWSRRDEVHFLGLLCIHLNAKTKTRTREMGSGIIV